jgi:MFS family permease
VAAFFLVWMPSFMKEKFGLNLAMAGLEATVFIQVASMFGAAAGGTMADRWRALRPGGRMLVQALGALLGAPFIFLCGTTRDHLTVIVAMTLFGFCKGIYDSNIWASLFDVIRPSRRGAGVGLMNMVAWLGGSLLGGFLPGVLSDAGITLSTTLAALTVFYGIVAGLLLLAGTVFAPADVKRAATVGG